jgi:hypothetical protein
MMSVSVPVEFSRAWAISAKVSGRADGDAGEYSGDESCDQDGQAEQSSAPNRGDRTVLGNRLESLRCRGLLSNDLGRRSVDPELAPEGTANTDGTVRGAVTQCQTHPAAAGALAFVAVAVAAIPDEQGYGDAHRDGAEHDSVRLAAAVVVAKSVDDRPADEQRDQHDQCVDRGCSDAGATRRRPGGHVFGPVRLVGRPACAVGAE